MKLTKIALAVSTVCLLNGCLEVDDNSNDALVKTLQEQNQILLDQQQQASRITISGVVVNAVDDKPVTGAKVQVKLGSEIIASDIDTTDGAFKIRDLPQNADIAIIISSEDSTFLARTFFISTGSASSEAMRDLGEFEVSEGIEVSISVLDSLTNEPIQNLVFEGNSSVGENATVRQYLHTSTFNETTGTYLITVPRYFPLSLKALLDLNKDGEADFVPEIPNYLSGTNLIIGSNLIKQNPTIYVSAVEEITTPIEFRLSLVDDLGEPIEGAEIIYNDNDGANQNGNYDAATMQYVVSVDFASSGTIEIPAFASNGIDYQSVVVSMYERSNGTIYITSNGNNAQSFDLPIASLVELAIQPNLSSGNNETNLSVLLKSDVNTQDASVSIFYSQPVTVDNANITLISQKGFSVVRGNDDPNDLVLPGTTLISGNKETPVTSTLTLNNTKLKIAPAEPLIAGMNYTYSVGEVEINSSKANVDISDDSVYFKAPYTASAAFNVNELRLDNNNYTTGGNLIKSSNTAGEAATYNNNDSSVYLILPDSIRGLKNFTLRKMIVVENNSTRTEVRNYEIVKQGELLNQVFSQGAVSVAKNENPVNENLSTSIMSGLSVPDNQSINLINTYENLRDNITGISENSITFEYAYEENDGNIVTGTITLPVN